MIIKVFQILPFLVILSFASEYCPDSTIFVDSRCLTANEISKTAGTSGHISSAFYGLGSGFNSIYPIIYSLNSLSYEGRDTDGFLRMLPSSITFITSGSINQLVKLKRKKMLQNLGVQKMKCRPLLIVGTLLFATSVASDLTHNFLYLSENDRLRSIVMVINSTTLTTSFIVNVIGKVIQAKELDQRAEELISNRNISFSPLIYHNDDKTGIGFILKF